MVLHPTVQNTPMSAAVSMWHLCDGLFTTTTSPDLIYNAWGQGALELSIELSYDASLLAWICDGLENKGLDFPGVYDYEVSCNYGAWIARQIMGRECLPSREERATKIRELAINFFSKDEVWPRDRIIKLLEELQ